MKQDFLMHVSGMASEELNNLECGIFPTVNNKKEKKNLEELVCG